MDHIIQLLSTAIAAIVLILIFFQLRSQVKQMKFQALSELHKELLRPPLQRALRFIHNCDPDVVTCLTSEDDIEKVELVINTYDLIGFRIRKRVLPNNETIETEWPILLRLWPKLEPFFIKQRLIRRDDQYKEHFLWLFKEAERFKKRPHCLYRGIENYKTNELLPAIRSSSNYIHVGRWHKIEFKIVIGNVSTSKYDSFHCHWLKSQFVPREPVAQISEPLWEKMVREAKQVSTDLTNGPLARLVGQAEDSKDTISLTLQPTNYKTFCTTNLLLDHPIVPHHKEPGLISIRELAGGDINNAVLYLANPLNVIAMLITPDQYTFLPKRSARVYESPGKWQASVGGALKLNENPVDALIRETEEEWNIEFKEEDIRININEYINFFQLGVNGHTGEPDLIAIIKTDIPFKGNEKKFLSVAKKPEFEIIEELHLDIKEIKELLLKVFSKEWSQPSDQAAYLVMLIRKFGMQHISDAIHTLSL